MRKMKKVFLLGDSIRIGYDLYVREKLSGEAEVYFTTDNCKYTQNLLWNLDMWLERECDPTTLDAVHWNAGLWDTLRQFGEEPLNTVEQYTQMLERIYLRIKKFCPNAKQIFATTTPIVESRFLEPDKRMRYNSDVVLYNRAALEKLKHLDISIDDLYSVAVKLDESCWSDMTHLYTPMGKKALGDAVLESIRKAL